MSSYAKKLPLPKLPTAFWIYKAYEMELLSV
jgi:hypothetical protein